MKKGLVIKSTGSWYHIKDDDGNVVLCKIRGKLRIKGIKSTNPVAVGDIISFETTDNKTGLILDLYERKNYIIRKSTNLSKQSHIIAANIDIAYLVVTIAVPETSLEFIDRFLVSAEAYRIPVTLVFNKTDLYTDEHIEYMNYLISIYKNVGYECLSLSALKKENIDDLKKNMKGKVCVIAGHSGVGKSTLINSLDSEMDLKVGDISEYHLKGTHTTTFAEMFELSFGAYVIDTPGIKGFGMFEIEKDEIYHFFPEIFKTAKKCKYYNCIHIHEPECAVIEAVKTGDIAESRYISYLSLYHDENTKHRK